MAGKFGEVATCPERGMRWNAGKDHRSSDFAINVSGLISLRKRGRVIEVVNEQEDLLILRPEFQNDDVIKDPLSDKKKIAFYST